MKTLVLVPVYIARRWGIHLAVIGVSVLLLLLVHRKVYDYFTHDSRYQIDLKTFKMANVPDWLIDEQLKSSVTYSLDCQINASVFDENIIQKIRAHYESSPWVKRVELIERRLPNDLKIKLELRKPSVAVAGAKGQYYLVSQDAVRLPGDYENLPALPYQMPIISGVRANPPVAGEIWNDPGLNAALQVMTHLEENKLVESLPVASIDVTNIGGRKDPRASEIILVTTGRVRIEWGRAPDTDKFGELPVAGKIKNLKTILEACPGLRGIRTVKIQFDEPYIALENK